MRVSPSRIKHHIFDILGLDRMGKAYQMLVAGYIFMMFYFTFESVFINTLLYRVNDDGMRAVIIYRAIVYSITAIFMQISAYLTQKISPLFTAKLGAFFYLMIFGAVLIGIDHMDILQYFIGIFSGIGGAFYWMAHSVMVPNYTTKHNRDAGISILGIIQGTMTLFVPILSGFVISFMPEISGYRIMALVAMIMVIAHFICMRKFHPVEQTTNQSKLKLAIKLISRKATFKLMFCYEFFRGVRDGTFAFFLNMLLFRIITDEGVIGINTFLTGIMAITGSWAYGKLVQQRTRFRYGIMSITILLIICTTLFFNMSIPTVMLFTVVNAFMQLFFQYSYNNTSYDIIAQNKTSRKCTAEIVAIREFPIAAGRLCGLGITMIVPPTQRGYVQVMLLLTLSQYIAMLLVRHTLSLLERKKQKVEVEPV